MIYEFDKLNKVLGELELPGDKSISHRALIFSAMAEEISYIENLSDGEDVNSTLTCLREIGAEIERVGNSAKVRGVGFKNFRKPNSALNAGNSGTTARLLCGLLAAQNFDSKIIGDESLSKRPMERVITPLKLMGANIKSAIEDKLPIEIFPVDNLNSINYKLPLPSAQVKSAVLIAGLHEDGITSIIDSFGTRDHTERMLNLPVIKSNEEKIINVSRMNYPKPQNYFIPSDISTASYFVVLTLLSKNSSLRLKNISLNPTRTGLIHLLKKMGAKIKVEKESIFNNEPVGDLLIESSELEELEIKEDIIPNIVDEIPILSIALILSAGRFRISNAEELRKKESDRIHSLCYNFRQLGLKVDEQSDGFEITGKIKNHHVIFESFGDHRIAMAFSIMSLLLKYGGKVNNFDCVRISNPNFIFQLKKIIQ